MKTDIYSAIFTIFVQVTKTITEMPFCPHCGYSVNPSFSFCPSCGNNLSGCNSDSPVPVLSSMRIESSSLSGMRGFYEGYALGGKPHGKGKVNWDNGDTYDGEWKNGLKEGYGIYQWNNGDRYEGDWVADKMEGQGKLEYWAVGGVKAMYQGSFAGGQKNGEGLLLLFGKNGHITSRISSDLWENDDLSGPYRYYSNNKYWDFKKYDGWLTGIAVDESGTEVYFYNGRILISKGKEYYQILVHRLWFIIKYFSNSSYLSESAGVYLLEDNAREAFNSINKENHYSNEKFILLDSALFSSEMPGAVCYLLLKTFTNSFSAPEFVRCFSTYDLAKEFMSRRTKNKYPSDREWDDENKCYWHIVETYLLDMPEL